MQERLQTIFENTGDDKLIVLSDGNVFRMSNDGEATYYSQKFKLTKIIVDRADVIKAVEATKEVGGIDAKEDTQSDIKSEVPTTKYEAKDASKKTTTIKKK